MVDNPLMSEALTLLRGWSGSYYTKNNVVGQEDCAVDDTTSPTCWAKLSSVSEADSTLLRLLERLDVTAAAELRVDRC
jgi:hypothetical protein